MSQLLIHSAVDWVLDQHKEKVIDLLQRVTMVSAQMEQIAEAMKGVV